MPFSVNKVTKQAIRKQMLDQRSQMTNEQVESFSALIVEHIRRIPAYVQAKVVAMYYPMAKEVNVLPLLTDSTKRFVFPKILDTKQKIMGFAPIVHTVKPGIFHTTEPDGEVIDPELIDLYLIPGLAFSPLMNRLGYGAGYYDFFLRQQRGYKIGVSYSCQIIDFIPHEDHDVLMDEWVTEEGSKVRDCH